MRRFKVVMAVMGVLLAATSVQPAFAAEGDAKPRAGKSYRAHKGTRVKGFIAHRGGYSYSSTESINTYGDARGWFNSTTSFRDSGFGRQTSSGPFDHGFFFDSGIGSPYGGNSPYMH